MIRKRTIKTSPPMEPESIMLHKWFSGDLLTLSTAGKAGSDFFSTVLLFVD